MMNTERDRVASRWMKGAVSNIRWGFESDNETLRSIGSDYERWCCKDRGIIKYKFWTPSFCYYDPTICEAYLSLDRKQRDAWKSLLTSCTLDKKKIIRMFLILFAFCRCFVGTEWERELNRERSETLEAIFEKELRFRLSSFNRCTCHIQ